MNLKDIVKKYFNRNKEYIFSDKIVHEMNGGVLFKTNDVIFEFNGAMSDEVREYCQSVGYNIDKIVFISSYDIEINHSREYNLKMQGDSKIKIVEEYGQIVAVVCIGEFVKIKERKYD